MQCRRAWSRDHAHGKKILLESIITKAQFMSLFGFNHGRNVVHEKMALEKED